MAIKVLRQALLRKTALGGAVGALLFANAAHARTLEFDLPPQPLSQSLDAFARIAGQQVIYRPELVDGKVAPPLRGKYTPEMALADLVNGSGLSVTRTPSGDAMIGSAQIAAPEAPIRLAQVTRKPATTVSTVETVVVTAQKESEDIQSVPIAVSAFTQKELKERQVATGGDLIRETPNMNFGKTNFSGYSIELRGIGTQAISVTTDPAVAVAFNGVPFLRNHFFEQEFFDLEDVEVLRGPQGTLYGRNATAGVVNLSSAKPTGEFEAMGSVDFGDYDNRRLEAMLNIPIVGDKLDIRVAGEWTKRDGYSVNELGNNKPIDGRDLWSSRVSVGWKPTDDFSAILVWEHFSEDDDRLRSGKQLCKTAPIPAQIDGVPITEFGGTNAAGDFLSQGCLPASLYSAESFQVPNGFSLPYYTALLSAGIELRSDFDPYANTTQSRNLRAVDSVVNPQYKAKNDIVELNGTYAISPTLTLASQTAYNQDFLWSTQDYNRFDTAPGAFVFDPSAAFNNLITLDPLAGKNGVPADAGVFCDPQLGCSDRLVLQDLSDEHAWQASQEFRLASNFDGPLNFSAGANYLHYETSEDYYVFINTLTLFAVDHLYQQATYIPGVTDDHQCLETSGSYRQISLADPQDPRGCTYVDPNPLGSINGNGHNYFRSQNPYALSSYAAFGEVYYKLTDELKLTAGLRFTDDQKHFAVIPSELLQSNSYGFLRTGSVNQEWDQFTGRAVVDYSPKLDFTDHTLVYASYSHGYKAGGANPPGAIYPTVSALDAIGVILNPIHPLTFKPEFIDAFELGTKNSLFDDTMTLNGDVFYYNYQNYQISEIVDRTAINQNFDAHVMGAELESSWEPLPGLRFNFAGGYENSQLATGSKNVDLIDRTAGNPNWMVVKPFVTTSSNCVLPPYVVAAALTIDNGAITDACATAYGAQFDPVTGLPFVPNPTVTSSGAAVPAGYPGFDPKTAPNNGQGFDKNLSHNQLPNAPPVTLSFGGQYTVPVMADWAATLRGDFYFQADSWARVFNDNPYDRLRGYTNLNLAVILNSTDGWQVMAYVKNVFDTTAITGDFLNSDDTGLTTNVFLTDPRLFGVRVTKQFGEGDAPALDEFAGLFVNTDGGRPVVWVELGGQLEQVGAPRDAYSPSFMPAITIPSQRAALDVQHPPTFSLGEDAEITYQPEDSDWQVVASVRYGRNGALHQKHQQTANAHVPVRDNFCFGTICRYFGGYSYYPTLHVKFADGRAQYSESHTIVDFKVGKDVGLGTLSPHGTSTLSAGLRFAQFTSNSHVTMRAIPDLHYPSAPISSFSQKYAFQKSSVNFHAFSGFTDRSRSFTGLGPTAQWDASTPFFNGEDNADVTLDWGLNLGVLFGRQKSQLHNRTQARSYYFKNFHRANNTNNQLVKGGYFGFQNPGRLEPGELAQTTSDPTINRDRTVVVPNLGAFAGLSYRYKNAKFSFGYRADVFLNAMDSGNASGPHSENRAFLGPFAHISIGLGG